MNTDEPRCYEIRLRGHLDDRWAPWFDGMSVRPEPGGTTVLRGRVADQAALHGLLARVHDLALPLISVLPDVADDPDDRHEEPCPRP